MPNLMHEKIARNTNPKDIPKKTESRLSFGIAKNKIHTGEVKINRSLIFLMSMLTLITNCVKCDGQILENLKAC